jgi:hypothetical protein
MSTIAPHVAEAITLARMHFVTVAGAVASASTQSRASGALAAAALIVVAAFVAAGSMAIGFFRQMAAVMSELLHMAAAMGAALLTMIVFAGLAIALFVHF